MPQDVSAAAYVIPPPAVVAVPVAGGGAFPVRRIFCVGRNYAAHAREMGSDPDRELPFFFCKPADALLMDGRDMPYPPMSKDLHHEMELVVAIGKGGADIAEAILWVTDRPPHVVIADMMVLPVAQAGPGLVSRRTS